MGSAPVVIRCHLFFALSLLQTDKLHSAKHLILSVSFFFFNLLLNSVDWQKQLGNVIYCYLAYQGLITTASVVCCDSNRHQKSMEVILEVGFGGQCPPGGRPHNPATWFHTPTTTVVSSEPFPYRSRALWGL